MCSHVSRSSSRNVGLLNMSAPVIHMVFHVERQVPADVCRSMSWKLPCKCSVLPSCFTILYILSILCHPASVLSGNPCGAHVSRSCAMVEAKHIHLHPNRLIAMVELTSEAPFHTHLQQAAPQHHCTRTSKLKFRACVSLRHRHEVISVLPPQTAS